MASPPGDVVAEVCDHALAAAPRAGSVRVVAIDGGAAAGKTSLADAVRAHLAATGADAAVLHTDRMLAGWSGQFTFWDRLRAGVLEPLRRGQAGRYDRYDWALDRFRGEVTVAVPDVLIVEGVSSIAACAAYAGTTVFLDVARAERERRWAERDGGDVAPLWRTWLDAEDHFFRSRPPQADITVRGGVRVRPSAP